MQFLFPNCSLDLTQLERPTSPLKFTYSNIIHNTGAESVLLRKLRRSRNTKSNNHPFVFLESLCDTLFPAADHFSATTRSDVCFIHV